LNIDVAPVAAAVTVPLVPATGVVSPAGASAAGAVSVFVPVVAVSVWSSAIRIVVDFGARRTTLSTVT
jgi:hypothetical protein